MEIACDESGFSGGNLALPHMVFVHASVRIDLAEAELVVDRLRRRTGARGELKAGHLLRRGDPSDLAWLLGPDGQVGQRARVLLIDTRFFLLARLVDVLLGDAPVVGVELPGSDPVTRDTAVLLRAEGERVFTAPVWQRLLTVAGYVLRGHSRWIPGSAVADFEDMVRELLSRPAPDAVRTVLLQLRAAGGRAGAARRALETDPRRTPLLEPLIPALAATVLHWTVTTPRLRVIHDEQSALTRHRIDEIGRLLATQRRGHVLELHRVDSQDDPRVQVADLVAGVAQRAATGVLTGQADDVLVELVRPLVDPASVWPNPTWRPFTDRRAWPRGEGRRPSARPA